MVSLEENPVQPPVAVSLSRMEKRSPVTTLKLAPQQAQKWSSNQTGEEATATH